MATARPGFPGSYDPETNSISYGTGNPTPAYTQGRGEGDNLFTSALIAVNVDTGKMAWYYQTSPHDTHDWDSTQTPILVDMPFNGRMRKLVMTATRNGYFFVLDRITGEHLLTSKFGLVNNWATGLDAKGQPKRNPNKDATIAGSLVNGDVTNYPPPTFSPETGLFYVHEQNSMRISYLMEPDPRGSMGLGGTSGGGNLSWGTYIVAIDYKTGKVAWRKEINGGSSGLLSTAGGLLFLSNGPNVEAWDAATGKGLWYSQIGGLSSPPETFMLDGKQHMLFTGANGLVSVRAELGTGDGRLSDEHSPRPVRPSPAECAAGRRAFGPAAAAQLRHRLRRRHGLRRHRPVQHDQGRGPPSHAEPRSHGRRGHPAHELLRGPGRLLGLARGAADGLLPEPRRHSRRAEPHGAARHQPERDDDRRSAEAARLCHGDLWQVASRAPAAVPARCATASTSTSACRTRTTCGRAIRSRRTSIPTCR